MILGIGHVGIIVKNLEGAVDFYRDLFGIEEMPEFTDWPEGEMRNAMLSVGKNHFELIEPYPESQFSKFLEKHGEGLHHVNLIVDDLDSLIKSLEDKGATLIARGPEMAFIHPGSTTGVLIELVHVDVLKRLNIPVP